MQAFEYIRPGDVASDVALVSGDPTAQSLAGGTPQIDLMLKDGVLEPERLVDITRLPLRGITRDGDVLRVGALATMEELAADATVAERLPFVREALLAGASPQLRNMATIGGDILQRTPSPDFRDPAGASWAQRAPRAGCVALGGVGTIPWRAPQAEAVLRGAPVDAQTFRAAADAAIHDPFTVAGTAFKVELAKRTLVRILQTVAGGGSS